MSERVGVCVRVRVRGKEIIIWHAGKRNAEREAWLRSEGGGIKRWKAKKRNGIARACALYRLFSSPAPTTASTGRRGFVVAAAALRCAAPLINKLRSRRRRSFFTHLK